MGMNIRPWNQAFLQNYQQAMLTPEQVQALIAQQQMQNVNPDLIAVGNTEVVKNPNLLYNWSPAVFDNKYSQHSPYIDDRTKAKQQYEAALDMYKNANKK